MQQQKWWGAVPGQMGWAVVLYDWLYIPLCNLIGAAPSSPTRYGLALMGIALVVNAFQITLDAHPQTRPS